MPVLIFNEPGPVLGTTIVMPILCLQKNPKCFGGIHTASDVHIRDVIAVLVNLSSSYKPCQEMDTAHVCLGWDELWLRSTYLSPWTVEGTQNEDRSARNVCLLLWSTSSLGAPETASFTASWKPKGRCPITTHCNTRHNLGQDAQMAVSCVITGRECQESKKHLKS